jgi:serine/threonine-protein kinase
VTLCDVVSEVYGAVWYPDNRILFADATKGILSVSAEGGTPELLVKGISITPQLLPDGKSILFTDVSSQPYRIVVQALKSGERKELFAGGGAQYLPTGHLVYWLQNNDNLFAVPFDLAKFEVGGAPVPVVEGVGVSVLSDSGTLVFIPYRRAAAAPGRTLVWVDRTGKEESLEVPPNMYLYPRISPDGTKLALSIAGTGRNVTSGSGFSSQCLDALDLRWDRGSVWSQDSKRIAFPIATMAMAFIRRQPMAPEVSSFIWERINGRSILLVERWKSFAHGAICRRWNEQPGRRGPVNGRRPSQQAASTG